MKFHLPEYHSPDFSLEKLQNAPVVKTESVFLDGIAPDFFHATSIFPEYFKINGRWMLAEESRMDCCIRVNNGKPEVIEPRNLKKGDLVVLGRTEHGEDGIFLHEDGFEEPDKRNERFSFRTGRSRETAFSKDYDSLYELLNYDKENGNILWVMGPACTFDADSRHAMEILIENGYVNGLLAGNALATHDLEAALFGTALGQNIYTQISQQNGHYNHLDLINKVRRSGSIANFIRTESIQNGIIYSCNQYGIPFVLTGSIRDDGPLPDVIANTYDGQDAMRNLIRKATTIICLATQLHTIATGNMTPCYRIMNGIIRPLFIYTIDISEFAVNKLSDRGSLTAKSIVTNVQDFLVMVSKGVTAIRNIDQPFE